MFLSLAVSLLLFISSLLSVLAAAQELTRLGRVRLYPLKGKFLMCLQKAPPPPPRLLLLSSLYLLSTFPLSSHLFFSRSLTVSPSLFLLFCLFERRGGFCYCRHFAPDKLSRCPSFPSASTLPSSTLPCIHPSTQPVNANPPPPPLAFS